MNTIEKLATEVTERTIELSGNSLIDTLKDEYKSWYFRRPVFIDAPTGTGKTTFVYEELIPNAIKENKTVLLVNNRRILSAQQKLAILNLIRTLQPDSVKDIPLDIDSADLEKHAFFGPVCVTTYQGLHSLINNTSSMITLPSDLYDWFHRLKYAVFDEIHFLYSDALFNPYCGGLLSIFLMSSKMSFGYI